MGAVPGAGVLTDSADGTAASDPPWFEPSWVDVEELRRQRRRLVVFRRPARRAVVLGTGQPATTVDRRRSEEAGTAVVRRRSGGGAVLVEPGNSVWVDAWVPTDDPLFDRDVVRSADWAGRWWVAALEGLGVVDGRVHQGPMVTSPFGELVCFATLAAGEVSVGHRKVVGVSQWRCRQGALLQCTCYLVWDPLPLLDVLRLPTRRRQEAARRLALGAVGTAALTGTPPTRTAAGGVGQVEQALIDHLPGNGWAVHRDDRPGTSPA